MLVPQPEGAVIAPKGNTVVDLKKSQLRMKEAIVPSYGNTKGFFNSATTFNQLLSSSFVLPSPFLRLRKLVTPDNQKSHLCLTTAVSVFELFHVMNARFAQKKKKKEMLLPAQLKL